MNSLDRLGGCCGCGFTTQAKTIIAYAWWPGFLEFPQPFTSWTPYAALPGAEYGVFNQQHQRPWFGTKYRTWRFVEEVAFHPNIHHSRDTIVITWDDTFGDLASVRRTFEDFLNPSASFERTWSRADGTYFGGAERFALRALPAPYRAAGSPPFDGGLYISELGGAGVHLPVVGLSATECLGEAHDEYKDWSVAITLDDADTFSAAAARSAALLDAINLMEPGRLHTMLEGDWLTPTARPAFFGYPSEVAAWRDNYDVSSPAGGNVVVIAPRRESGGHAIFLRARDAGIPYKPGADGSPQAGFHAALGVPLQVTPPSGRNWWDYPQSDLAILAGRTALQTATGIKCGAPPFNFEAVWPVDAVTGERAAALCGRGNQPAGEYIFDPDTVTTVAAYGDAWLVGPGWLGVFPPPDCCP